MNVANNVIETIFKFLKRNTTDYEWELCLREKHGFCIVRNGKSVKIEYSNKAYLTMALGYLLSNEQQQTFSYSQALKTERLGAFLDCARNNVAKIENLKNFALNAAFVGYNYLQLYLEDCFELDGEGYFGYMRGRYTTAELKELNEFCDAIGVELTPCIQTLAHLANIFRHEAYACINDCNDILLVDEEKTYALIRKMFAKVKECFTSNCVNVGMDEAHMLGAGKYLDRFGYKHRSLIIREHLKKVVEISKEYGLEISMFSDMFFRVLLNGDYYDDNDQLKTMPEEIVKIVPEEVSLVYWDYYHVKTADYQRMLKLHKDLTNKVIFAGGAWKWQGFAPYNQYTCDTVFPALEACKKYDIQDIMLTSWGDDGGECSFNALLGAFAVCAEKLYENPVPEEQTDAMCQFMTGYNKEELFMLDLPNAIFDLEYNRSNPCKFLFYDDLLIGTYSDKSDDSTSGRYAENAKKLEPLTKRDSKYSYLFSTMYELCQFLEIKADLGRKIRKAYKNNDEAFLRETAEKTLLELETRLKKFYEAYFYQWEKESKTFGFEVQDARIGGLLLRFEHVKKRLQRFIENGEKIAELEEDFLPAADYAWLSIIEAKKAITPSQIF